MLSILLLGFFLILLGGSRPKIALWIAGLIFLGALLNNSGKLAGLLNGDYIKYSVSTIHKASSGTTHGGAGGSF